MSRIASLLVPLLMMGCAELLASGEPGTPEGGAYCFKSPATWRMACYQNEKERDAAYRTSEESERRAVQAVQAAAAAEENERLQRVQAAKEKASTEEAAAREENDRRRAAFIAERDRKEAPRLAAAAEVHRMALDKEYAGPAISAIMCSIDDEVMSLRAALAREKRVAAVGGVVNLKARNDIASDLVDDADELVGWQRALARYGSSRVPCKDVATVEPCHQNPESCEGKTRDIARVWASEMGTLWGSDKPHPSR